MMPRKRGAAGAIPDVVERGRWVWGDANASATTVGEWDIKEHDLWVAVRAVLASGCAVRLGTTSDGGAVSVTLYDGNTQPERKYVANSIEFDDLMADIIRMAKRLGVGEFGQTPYSNGATAEAR